MGEYLKDSVLFVSILSWFVAQVIKVILTLITSKKFDFHRFVGSGGMPSSHSALVCSLTTSVGLIEGFQSILFAMCTIFSLIVMYDAAGVRYAAGQQAKVLNQIVDEFEVKSTVSEKKLKELLGHTPKQVFCGALLGIAIALICYFK